MTVDTDIFRRAGVDVPTDDKARRAVKTFRALQPTLTAYARNLTGRKDVIVEMAARDNGSTDGKKIYYRPPIALGEEVTHDRRACDKRDPATMELLCRACWVREDVLVTIYHEIGHIAFESFQQVTPEDVELTMRKAIEEVGTKYAKKIKAALDAAPARVKDSYIGLSNYVSPFLPFLVNCLEDARVNSRMFQARPGTKVMFDASTARIFREGVEQVDRATGELKVVPWNVYPLNAQVTLGCFCIASGYTFSGWFAPEVEEALKDTKLNQLVRQIDTVRSAAGVYHLAFPVLARLRELGYCKSDTDPVDEDETSEEEPSDEPQPEGESEDKTDDGGSDNAESGESSGDDAGDTSEDDDGTGPGDESSSDGDSGDGEPSGDDEGEQAADASNDAGEADGDSSDGPSSGDPAEAGSSGSDSEEGSEEASDGEESGRAGGTDGGSDSADEAEERTGGDDEGDSSDDSSGGSTSESGPAGSDGSESDGADLGSDDAGLGDDVDEESAEDAEGESGTGDIDGPKLDEGSGGESEASSGGDSSPNGEADERGDLGGDSDLGDDEAAGRIDYDLPPEADEVGSDGDGESSGQLDGDDEAGWEHLDTDADEGEGGADLIDNPANDDVPLGTPEDVEWALVKLGDHEDKPTSVEEQAAEQAVDRAIVQGLYFETPSRNIFGVREHRHGEPIFVDGYNTSQAWDLTGSSYRAMGFQEYQMGRTGDFHCPESILGPALVRMRVAFSENARGKNERNLKSGKVNGKSLGKRAWNGDDRLFRKRTLPGKRNYFVCIGLDVSGSTVGRNIVLEKRAAMAQATLCQRLGVQFAIYAHSGNLHSPTTGRSNGLDLDVYLIKEPKEIWTEKVQQRLLDLGPDSANLDGHFMEYLRKRCDEVQATDKIILYYSDGKMPAENHDEELEILQRELQLCARKQYTVMGVGIRTDSPARHGLDTVQVDTDEDIVKVVKHLEKKLR